MIFSMSRLVSMCNLCARRIPSSATRIGAIVVKEISAMRSTVVVSTPLPMIPAVAAKSEEAPESAPRAPTARAPAHRPGRPSAPSPSGAVPPPKVDAPGFSLAPAPAAAKPAVAVGSSRSKSAGVSGAGGRSGASGGSGGNDYYAPEAEETVCPLCGKTRTLPDTNSSAPGGGLCRHGRTLHPGPVSSALQALQVPSVQPLAPPPPAD